MYRAIAVLEVGGYCRRVRIDCGSKRLAERDSTGVESAELVEAVISVANRRRGQDCRR